MVSVNVRFREKSGHRTLAEVSGLLENGLDRRSSSPSLADLNPVKVRVKTVNAFQPAGIVYGHVSGGALGESITPRMLVSSRHSRGFTGMSAPSSEADVAASAANFRYGPTSGRQRPTPDDASAQAKPRDLPRLSRSSFEALCTIPAPFLAGEATTERRTAASLRVRP
jgi:hypothetical protein